MQIIEVKKQIHVSAAIFIKNQRILFTTRKKKKFFNNYLEFPGGKVEKGESTLICLKREIKEELSINLSSATNFDEYVYSFKNLEINLNFFLCNKWSGKFIPLEGQKIKWINIHKIPLYKILPSNKRVILKIFKYLTNYST